MKNSTLGLRRARRAALAAVLATATFGAVATSAQAGPFKQKVGLCIATGCNEVPLPDGLPNIASGLTSAVGTACAPIRETILVNQAGTAYVGLCTHELDTLVPVIAYAGGNGAITFSDSYSSSACYADVVAGIVSAGSTVAASGGIVSGTCE